MNDAKSKPQVFLVGSAEGEAEAGRRIADAQRTGATELDLGGLGLVRIPENLLALGQLRVLYLGLPKELSDKPYYLRAEKEAYNDIGVLPPALFNSLPHLTRLGLERNNLHALPAEIARLTDLTSLDLSDNRLGDADALALASLVNLTSLDLRDNWIGDAGAQSLAGLVNLTSLGLGGYKVRRSPHKAGDAGAQALAALVNLTSLDLWYNNIGDAGAEALAGLNNLNSLSLRYNHIGDAGVQALAGLVNLTSLDLHMNKMGDMGAQALASLVNLTSLDLGGNEIGDAGARALAGLVNLTSLNLEGNYIGAAGAQALSGLVNLTSLDLWGNNIGDAGARALAGLVNLTSLDLANSDVENLSPLMKLSLLETLDCSNCRLENTPPELWMMASLRRVILHETTLLGVPAEVLSQYRDMSCLERLRAHFADLASGEREVADIKLMILGNGRDIGPKPSN
jgi:Leucine-rich repeat (LRR) protein